MTAPGGAPGDTTAVADLIRDLPAPLLAMLKAGVAQRTTGTVRLHLVDGDRAGRIEVDVAEARRELGYDAP